MTGNGQPEAHPAIAPVSFLLGTWEGIGKGGYPTISDFDFIQQVNFTHIGKPYLVYTSRTWRLEEGPDGQLRRGEPLALETGFWRPQPGNKIEVVLSHPTGINEIYVGEVTGTKIELVTDVVARTETAKPVTGGKRLYGLIDSPDSPGAKDLAYAYDMAAMDKPLAPHLSAQLAPASSGRFRWIWNED
jgi:hypothetical protein